MHKYSKAIIYYDIVFQYCINSFAHLSFNVNLLKMLMLYFIYIKDKYACQIFEVFGKCLFINYIIFNCMWLRTKKSFVTSYIIFVKLYLGSKISVLGDILYGKTMIL